MTFGSSILIRFRGVHSHRSHSDTVTVLSSSVHLAQESRTNHKSNHKISKDTSYMRHSVRWPPPWVWVMPMGAWLSSTNSAHSPRWLCRQSQLLWSKGKEIRGKKKNREREREKCIRDKCDLIEFMLESVRIQQQTTFLVRSLGCSSSWSSEGLDVATGFFCQRLVRLTETACSTVTR